MVLPLVAASDKRQLQFYSPFDDLPVNRLANSKMRKISKIALQGGRDPLIRSSLANRARVVRLPDSEMPLQQFFETVKSAITERLPDQLKSHLESSVAKKLSIEAWEKLFDFASEQKILSKKSPDGEAAVKLLLDLPVLPMKEKLKRLSMGAVKVADRELILYLMEPLYFSRELLTNIFDSLPPKENFTFWFANRYGARLMSEIAKQKKWGLLNKLFTTATSHTIHQAMLPIIAKQPAVALSILTRLKKIQWITNSKETAKILDILVTHYTPEHRTLAHTFFDQLKNYPLEKPDINNLFQRITAPTENLPPAKLEFHQFLAAWLIYRESYPDPYTWGQALWRCVDQGQREMVEILWGMTASAEIPKEKLPPEWQTFMIEQYRMLNDNDAYIRLAPLFFDLPFKESSMGEKEIDDACKYKSHDQEWLRALEFSLADRRAKIKSLIVKKVAQHNDPEILLGAIQLLLQYKDYASLDIFSPQAIAKLRELDLRQLMEQTGEISRQTDLDAFKWRLRNERKKREEGTSIWTSDLI